MSRGAPDFGMYAAKEVTASISDMGEVAARLGSIDIYDKRGDVVEFDAFEDAVLKWRIETQVDTEYARLDSEHVRSGSQSVKLYVPDTDGASVYMMKTLSLLASKQIGIEISWHGFLQHAVMFFYVDRYDGTTRRYAEVWFDSATDKIYVYVSPTEYHEVTPTQFFVPFEHEFRTVKLVVDFNTGMYKRLMFEVNEYDISDVSLYSVGSEGRPSIDMGFGVDAVGGFGDTIWLDDFIITQAEP